MSVSSDLETLELVLIGSLLVCYSGSIDGKQSDITIKKFISLEDFLTLIPNSPKAKFRKRIKREMRIWRMNNEFTYLAIQAFKVKGPYDSSSSSTASLLSSDFARLLELSTIKICWV